MDEQVRQTIREAMDPWAEERPDSGAVVDMIMDIAGTASSYADRAFALVVAIRLVRRTWLDVRRFGWRAYFSALYDELAERSPMFVEVARQSRPSFLRQLAAKYARDTALQADELYSDTAHLRGNLVNVVEHGWERLPAEEWYEANRGFMNQLTHLPPTRVGRVFFVVPRAKPLTPRACAFVKHYSEHGYEVKIVRPGDVPVEDLAFSGDNGVVYRLPNWIGSRRLTPTEVASFQRSITDVKGEAVGEARSRLADDWGHWDNKIARGPHR